MPSCVVEWLGKREHSARYMSSTVDDNMTPVLRQHRLRTAFLSLVTTVASPPLVPVANPWVNHG